MAESLVVDPVQSAREAGLKYVKPGTPGLRRVRRGKTFFYLDAGGARVDDVEVLARIRSLAIPPAWTDVWICPDERGHLQATGRDARGRKQYRYHPRFRAVRDETKYGRLAAFARALPRIRAAVEQDLKRDVLCKEKVVACVVRLLEMTQARVGNEEYKRQNGSYGLTTLLDEHADITASKVRLHFRGKSGVEHELEVKDPRLARIVKRCQDLPGEELFRYVDAEGRSCPVESGDVNEYLRSVAGEEFTAKDFRTWAGTLYAAHCLHACPPCKTKKQQDKNVVQAIKDTAALLRNRPATCKKFYVHPAVVEAYRSGALPEAWAHDAKLPEVEGLSVEERAVLLLLETTSLPKLEKEKKQRSLAAQLQESRRAVRAKRRAPGKAKSGSGRKRRAA